MALLGELGELNFLLIDGTHLVAFANSGLHHVQRACVETSCRQQVALLATTPLTGERWRRLQLGRLHVFVGGAEVSRTETVA